MSARFNLLHVHLVPFSHLFWSFIFTFHHDLFNLILVNITMSNYVFLCDCQIMGEGWTGGRGLSVGPTLAASCLPGRGQELANSLAVVDEPVTAIHLSALFLFLYSLLIGYFFVYFSPLNVFFSFYTFFRTTLKLRYSWNNFKRQQCCFRRLLSF